MTNPRRSHRVAASAAVAALLAVALAPSAAPEPARATVPPAPRSCPTTMAIVRHVLVDRLHGDPAGWSLSDRTDAYGMTIPTGTNTSRVEISRIAPCRLVPSIVHHEWMHQQQMRWFGRPALDQRDDVEIMADCGSWLLGSDYTPYIDRARRTGAGCSTVELRYARAMIEAAGVAAVR